MGISRLNKFVTSKYFTFVEGINSANAYVCCASDLSELFAVRYLNQLKLLTFS